MNQYQQAMIEKYRILNGKPKLELTKLQRMYKTYDVLRVKFSRLKDAGDQERIKKGLARVKHLEQHIKEEQDRRYYVDGAIYESRGGQFCLVKPSGKDAKPYVWSSPKQSTLTRHHSHHYLLSEDCQTATLVKDSWEALFDGHTEAPEHATLSEEDANGVILRIRHGDIYKCPWERQEDQS